MFVNVVSLNEKYLNNYDVVMIGGIDACDNYFTNKENLMVLIQKVKAYHNDGKSILFLHDAIFVQHLLWKEFTEPLFGKYKNLNYDENDKSWFTSNSIKLDKDDPFVSKYAFNLSEQINDGKMAIARSHQTIIWEKEEKIKRIMYGDIHEKRPNARHYIEVDRVGLIEATHTPINENEEKLIYNIVCYLSTQHI